jgi:glycosyltransferase involved in cell wall biosynthesis
LNILFFYRGTILKNSGGVQNVASIIADFLSTKNIQVYFLSLENEKYFNFKYFYLPMEENINSNINIDYTSELINKLSINYVFNFDGLNSDVLIFFSKLKLCQNFVLINIIHNTFLPKNIFFNKYLKLYFKYLYLIIYYILKQSYFYKLDKCSNSIILFSKSNFNDIFYFNNSKKFKNKIYYIPNPIKLPISNKMIFKKNQLIYVGRLDDNQKNLRYILILWSRLFLKYHDWQLLILGTGIDRDKLINFSEQLNLKNIYFLGNVNPHQYYKKSKFLILTSRFEGWPMVIPEAMSYGCVPCVLNSFTSLNDMIINDYNGYIFDDMNVSKNTKKIENILTSNNFLQISKNCINTSKKFSIEQIGLKWTELLR